MSAATLSNHRKKLLGAVLRLGGKFAESQSSERRHRPPYPDGDDVGMLGF